MIVPRCAVAGLIALASSTRRAVSAQPFPTLQAKIPEEEQQQHGEFGNVAAESSNSAGADDGRPGTFQFLGGGDDGDKEENAEEYDGAAKSHKGGVDDVEADGTDAAVPTGAPSLANPTIA